MSPRSRKAGAIEEAAERKRQTESELAIAKHESTELSERIERLEKQLAHEAQSLEAAQSAALSSVKPRRLLTAYALWFFMPFAWPGAYLFYLGRDAHALLHTVTFGGFGVGWLVDAFYIPQYVADHNENPGYHEIASQRLARWWAIPSLALAPLSLLLQMCVGMYLGSVAAYLVPQPSVTEQSTWRSAALTLGYCSGMLAATLGIRLACTRIGRSRCACRWRTLVGWAVFGTAVLRSTMDEQKENDGGFLPQLIVGSAFIMVGAAAGRVEDMRLRPRTTTARRLSVRLVLQLTGVVTFAAACTGAFYLNGSFTHTSKETGKTVTYSGPQALAEAWKQIGAISTDLSHALHVFRQQQQQKTWSEIIEELRAAFRDPCVEAAEVLGVRVDATLAEIKSAHRKLALQYHPDKVDVALVGEAGVEEAKMKMQRLNWAKEVLHAKRS